MASLVFTAHKLKRRIFGHKKSLFRVEQGDFGYKKGTAKRFPNIIQNKENTRRA